MAVCGKRPLRAKIVIDNKIIQQVNEFVYLGSHISLYSYQLDINKNIIKYNQLNGILRRNFGNKMRQEIQIRFHNDKISKPVLL